MLWRLFWLLSHVSFNFISLIFTLGLVFFFVCLWSWLWWLTHDYVTNLVSPPSVISMCNPELHQEIPIAVWIKRIPIWDMWKFLRVRKYIYRRKEVWKNLDSDISTHTQARWGIVCISRKTILWLVTYYSLTLNACQEFSPLWHA